MQGEAQQHNQQQGGERAQGRRHKKAAPPASYGDHDKHHFDALHHGDLERRADGHVIPSRREASKRPQGSAFLGVSRVLVMQSDDARRAR